MKTWLWLIVVPAFLGLPLAAEEGREKEEVEIEEMDPEERLEQALERRVSFEFVDTPLIEAVQFIQALTKVNIVLDPKVAEDAAGKKITLRVTDMPLHQALRWIVRLADCEMRPREGALYVYKTDPNPRKIGEVEIHYGGLRLMFEVTEADLPQDMRRDIVGFIIDRMHEEAEREENRRERDEERRERMRPQIRGLPDNLPPEMRERLQMMLEKRRKGGEDIDKRRKMMEKMRRLGDDDAPVKENPPKDEVF